MGKATCHLEIIPNGYAHWIVVGRIQVEDKYYNQLDNTWEPCEKWVEVHHRHSVGSYFKVEQQARNNLENRGYKVTLNGYK